MAGASACSWRLRRISETCTLFTTIDDTLVSGLPDNYGDYTYQSTASARCLGQMLLMALNNIFSPAFRGSLSSFCEFILRISTLAHWRLQNPTLQKVSLGCGDVCHTFYSRR